MSNAPVKTITAVTPVRICDLGGWTDTWFAGTGAVFNIAVYPYTEVQIQVFDRAEDEEPRITVFAENFGERYDINPRNIVYDRHPLIEAAFDIAGIPDRYRLGVTLYSDAPAGCSTGTSAAVTVALLGALAALSGKTIVPYEIARLAHRVETDKLGLQSGIQDQLASAYGGINFIRMHQYPEASVSQLQIPDNVWWELERRLVLIYLGKAHSSSEVHTKVISELEAEGPESPRLESLRHAAMAGKDAVLAGDFTAFGKAMVDNTNAQDALHPEIISRDARKIIGIAQEYRAAGWKVNGAGGGGGSITILCDEHSNRKREMIRAIQDANPLYKYIPTYLARRGIRTWQS
jgi:D-glycero-alpha-D-manno-heptose-7-phosphate kinase